MMSTINNGGPAFPINDPQSVHAVAEAAIVGIKDAGKRDAAYTKARAEAVSGMTLRDYFAAKALPIAWAAYDQGYTGQPECVEQSIAHHSYQIADAMLRARESA